MDNNTFRYSYSAERNREVETIRNRYMPSKESKLDMLKRLDRRVQGAGKIEALSLGVIGALVFGVGLCFALGALHADGWMALLAMIIGTGMMIPPYPLHKHLSEKRKAELTPEILRLSEEIIRSGKSEN